MLRLDPLLITLRKEFSDDGCSCSAMERSQQVATEMAEAELSRLRQAIETCQQELLLLSRSPANRRGDSEGFRSAASALSRCLQGCTPQTHSVDSCHRSLLRELRLNSERASSSARRYPHRVSSKTVHKMLLALVNDFAD